MIWGRGASDGGGAGSGRAGIGSRAGTGSGAVASAGASASAGAGAGSGAGAGAGGSPVTIEGAGSGAGAGSGTTGTVAASAAAAATGGSGATAGASSAVAAVTTATGTGGAASTTGNARAGADCGSGKGGGGSSSRRRKSGTSTRRSCQGQPKPGRPGPLPPKVRLASSACTVSDTASAVTKRLCSAESRGCTGRCRRPDRAGGRWGGPAGFKQAPPAVPTRTVIALPVVASLASARLSTAHVAPPRVGKATGSVSVGPAPGRAVGQPGELPGMAAPATLAARRAARAGLPVPQALPRTFNVGCGTGPSSLPSWPSRHERRGVSSGQSALLADTRRSRGVPRGRRPCPASVRCRAAKRSRCAA